MPQPRTLLCVHPHPDDESIACGGVLAKAARDGNRPVVVTCTGGEAGENLAGIDLGGEDLITHRRRELEGALAALGVGEHRWLGYRDSGMAGTPENEHPDSFHRADLDEAAGRLAGLVREIRPDVVVSDAENGSYGHPDHVKAHLVTVRAVALAADPMAPLEGPPWRVPKRYVHALGRRRVLEVQAALRAAGLPSPFGDEVPERPEDLPFGSPDELITTEIDVTDVLPHKRAALEAYRTQIAPDSFFLNAIEGQAGPLFAREQFILEEGGGGPERPERDLFAGLV